MLIIIKKKTKNTYFEINDFLWGGSWSFKGAWTRLLTVVFFTELDFLRNDNIKNDSEFDVFFDVILGSIGEWISR